MKQLSPSSPVWVLIEHNHKCAQGSRRVTAQRSGKRREAKSTEFIFHEDPEASEKPENAMKRIGVCPGRRSDFVGPASSCTSAPTSSFLATRMGAYG